MSDLTEVKKFASANDGSEVTLSVFPVAQLDEVCIHRHVVFSNPRAMGGYAVAQALPIRSQDWPALRAAIDEMLTPKPDKHAPLYAAMRKTPR